MKKKYLLIGVPILLIILVLCIFLFSDKTSKYTDNTIDTIRDAIKFIQKNNYNRTGKLKVVASYKGAHGEHYPKDFNYFFETTIVDSNKKVTIGDGKNFVTQDYESDTYDIMYKLKNANVSKLDYLSVKKNGKENLLDVDIINDVFKTNFNKCTIDIKTSGILKNLESSTIKCDNTLTIKLEENKALINYKENVIKVTTNQKGFSINVNDE